MSHLVQPLFSSEPSVPRYMSSMRNAAMFLRGHSVKRLQAELGLTGHVSVSTRCMLIAWLTQHCSEAVRLCCHVFPVMVMFLTIQKCVQLFAALDVYIQGYQSQIQKRMSHSTGTLELICPVCKYECTLSSII